jgi:hypothetical protein
MNSEELKTSYPNKAFEIMTAIIKNAYISITHFNKFYREYINDVRVAL